MTREVLISISGSQRSGGEPDVMELMITGDYFEKNGKRYVIYEEILEDGGGTIRNTIKIMPDLVSIDKKGQVSAHMVFQKNQKNMTCYLTPFGQMMIGISTDDIRLQEEEDQLKVDVDYSLDINYEHVSDCNISLAVKSLPQA